jgi:HK97 family phage major capsid protein
MLRLIELKETREAKRAEAAAIVDGDLDDNKRARFDTLKTELRVLDGDILRLETMAEYERRAAGKPVTGDSADREFADLVGKFEMRQVVLNLAENRPFTGETAEVINELRGKGGIQGVPVPWAGLERRVGETVASGVPNPMNTRPIIDRIFPDSAAVRMGGELISIDSGDVEYPVCTSAVAAAWSATETGSVGGPTAYATTDKPMTPANTLGITMKITRKSMKQNGDALEQAIRRDMAGAIGVAMDKAVFLGAGSSGEPAGVLVGSYGITSTSVAAAASWAAFRAAVKRFITANAAGSPADVHLLLRPEVWDTMDNVVLTGSDSSEWDRMLANIPAKNIVMSSNALAAPTGSPLASKALLTTNVNGVAPIFVGLWGAIDVIRDPYSDAASGGLRLTALATMDVTVARGAQLEILTGIQ